MAGNPNHPVAPAAQLTDEELFRNLVKGGATEKDAAKQVAKAAERRAEEDASKKFGEKYVEKLKQGLTGKDAIEAAEDELKKEAKEAALELTEKAAGKAAVKLASKVVRIGGVLVDIAFVVKDYSHADDAQDKVKAVAGGVGFWGGCAGAVGVIAPEDGALAASGIGTLPALGIAALACAGGGISAEWATHRIVDGSAGLMDSDNQKRLVEEFKAFKADCALVENSQASAQDRKNMMDALADEKANLEKHLNKDLERHSWTSGSMYENEDQFEGRMELINKNYEAANTAYQNPKGGRSK